MPLAGYLTLTRVGLIIYKVEFPSPEARGDFILSLGFSFYQGMFQFIQFIVAHFTKSSLLHLGIHIFVKQFKGNFIRQGLHWVTPSQWRVPQITPLNFKAFNVHIKPWLFFPVWRVKATPLEGASTPRYMTATWSSHLSWPWGLQSLIYYLPHALCQVNILWVRVFFKCKASLGFTKTQLASMI